MPVGIGYENPTRVNTTQSNAPEIKRREEPRELESASTANEQRARDKAAQRNGLLAQPADTVIRPDANTIKTLQSNESEPKLDNASGLGKTAIAAYGSLAKQEFDDSISNKVKIDVTS